MLVVIGNLIPPRALCLNLFSLSMPLSLFRIVPFEGSSIFRGGSRDSRSKRTSRKIRGLSTESGWTTLDSCTIDCTRNIVPRSLFIRWPWVINQLPDSIEGDDAYLFELIFWQFSEDDVSNNEDAVGSSSHDDLSDDDDGYNSGIDSDDIHFII